MCGIMGYIGNREACGIVFNGLKKLEYRGYDSVGIAVMDTTIETVKTVGDTSKLNTSSDALSGHIAIGHTRWATHGKPSVENAHPHTFGKITLVHNGIIENYEDLKLSVDASKLVSQTDTEVLAALIDKNYQTSNDLLRAVKQSLTQVKGTFGLAILCPDTPDQIIVARRGSPIIIGVSKNQKYIASDSTAILDHTDKVIYLEDDQIAQVTENSVEIYDLKLNQQNIAFEVLEQTQLDTEMGAYGSFLEKEIYEQPKALTNTMRGRVSPDKIVLGGPNLSESDIKRLRSIVIIGCGTAYYAALYAKYELEKILAIPVTVEHASEFRYRHNPLSPASSLAIFMSQSGETADTLASLQEAKRRGFKTMGIVNAVGSTIAREVTHGGIYLHAGTESSVASTKAYSSMVTALLMFGTFISYKQGHDLARIHTVARELLSLPNEIEHTLSLHASIDKIAQKIAKYQDWFILGRGQLYPVALEGALKLSEVAYIHAQGFPTGEMKHGPIALIDEQHLSILLMPEDELLYEKSVSALEEIKARGGSVLTIGTRPKEGLADYHLEIAHAGDYIDGLLYTVCLQLLTLSLATKKKLNIDRPRNLAKSVTVE